MNLWGIPLPSWLGKMGPHPFAFTPMIPMSQARELIGRVRGGDFTSRRTIKLAFGVGGCVNELRHTNGFPDDESIPMDELLTQVEHGLSWIDEGADAPDWLASCLLMIVRRVLCQGEQQS